MIKPEKINEIRDRASIVEVISDYVTLKKTGRNYMGLCPFHAEKTPSFTVSEEKGIFHCFGCGAGGAVFQFLMQIDRLSFPEALERLAKRYGITIERDEHGPGARQANEREALYRINERAAANYRKMLASHPDVKVAQTVGVPHATLGEMVVACVVSSVMTPKKTVAPMMTGRRPTRSASMLQRNAPSSTPKLAAANTPPSSDGAIPH